jgi:hypothetical protein
VPLIDTSNPEANWHEVLSLWSRIANWTHYKQSERELRLELKQLAIALWSEKDWLKAEYPAKSKKIENTLGASENLLIVADMANASKHRVLRGSRSSAVPTNHYGRVSTGGGANRRLYFFRRIDGSHVEVLVVLRKALDELQEFRFELRYGRM